MKQPGVNNGDSEKPAAASWMTAILPILWWIPRYSSEWLKRDIIAGLTLAAYAVPVGIAYSSLAGLPPQSGLYCFVFGGAVYALFGSSRHLAIGPTAAISVMVASVVGSMAGGDSSLYAAIASATAGLVAVIYFLAWLFRLSAFVNFISETILLGFKAGAALSIAATQLPKLFGLPGGGDHFFQRIVILIGQLGDSNPAVLIRGVGALALLAAGERLFPKRPVALLVVVLSTFAVSIFGLAGFGVKVAGFIPQGLPGFRFPHLESRHLEGILELAFACFLLSYVESISAARALALKHDYRVDPRQELLGLGAANLAAALGQGYPVAGGLSQSAVNEEAGARTPMALLVASAALIMALLFLTGLLRNLPDAVLAAIVIVALSSFVKVADFRRLRQVSRLEFHVAMVAFAAVLFLGILRGVMFSAVVSILFLLRLMAAPHVAPLGRIPGTERFTDLTRHPDNEFIPGLFMFRVEAPLLYFNVESVDKTVLEYVHAEAEQVRLVVCDLSTSPYIDAAGAGMLSRLEEQLGNEGIQFRVAEAHAEVRDILRSTGVDSRIGGVSRHTSITDIIDEFNARRS
jgi:high affinity sulfate transporter 1